jgi:Alpha/beta hydrolase domain
MLLGDVVHCAVELLDDEWDGAFDVDPVMAKAARNPLRAFPARQLLTGGFSGAGATMLFYVNEGFPASARMPDGSPIFDGYLVGEPSRYPRVNSTVGEQDELPDDDPTQKVQPRDVPAIQLYSMDFEFEFGKGRFRADSDEPGDRFRQWVVPGAYHAGRSGAAGLEQMAGHKLECAHPVSTLPLDLYFPLALDHLKRWARGVGIPPHARPISMGPDGRAVLDADQNPIGGVPSGRWTCRPRAIPRTVPTSRAASSGPRSRSVPRSCASSTAPATRTSRGSNGTSES